MKIKKPSPKQEYESLSREERLALDIRAFTEMLGNPAKKLPDLPGEIPDLLKWDFSKVTTSHVAGEVVL